MATIDIQITLDDATLEKDFFETLASQNPQALIDSLGVGDSVEGIASITPEDKKTFVLSQVGQQLVDSYRSVKIQKATAALQRSLNETTEGVIKAKPVQKKPKAEK